eukprot:jgi/Mesvir1/17923/Mv12986-RA.1
MMASRGKTSAAPQAAQPLRLLYCDDDGKFRLGQEAVDALKAVHGPVGVVSVCGRARQGKSFLLNQLLGRSSGFVVAPTHRPCTKGLWMWSAPIPQKTADGTPYHLILLDSEGIDAYDQTNTYSTQIFSLAVLLSSMFVYNQMGGIDEAAIDRLSLVTEMTKHIHVRASGGEEGKDAGPASAAELSVFSPSFLWLLRDFYFDLRDPDGRELTPKDYLETALMPTPGMGPAVAAKNQIRESIRQLFPDRSCFTLVRPVNDERDLQDMENVGHGKMRPQFLAAMEQLTRFIFARARPKAMNGVNLSGSMLAELAGAYVCAINKGAVPTIATAWQSVSEAECLRAHDAGLHAYDENLDTSVVPEESALLGAHKRAMAAARAAFSKRAVGDPSLQRRFEERMTSALEDKFQAFQTHKFAAADAESSSLVSTMTSALHAHALLPDATIASASQLLDDKIAHYVQIAKGPGRWQRLIDFMRTGAIPALKGIAARDKEAAARELARLRDACAQLETAKGAAERAASEAKGEASEWQVRHDALKAEAERKIRDAQERLNTAADRASEVLGAKDKELSALRAERDKELSALRAERDKEVSALRAERDKVERERAAAVAEATKLRELGTAREAAAQRELASKDGAHARVAGELAAAHQRVTALESSSSALQQRLHASEDSLAKLQAAHGDVGRRLAEAESRGAAAEATAGAVKRQLEVAVMEAERRAAEHARAMDAAEQRERALQADKRALEATNSALRDKAAENEAALNAKMQKYKEQAMAAAASSGQQLLASATTTNSNNNNSNSAAASRRASGVMAAIDGAATPGDEDSFHDAPQESEDMAAADASGGEPEARVARMTLGDATNIAMTPQKRARGGGRTAAPAVAVAEEGPVGGRACAGMANGGVDPESLTVAELKRALTDQGFGDRVFLLKNAKKKDFVTLYHEVMTGSNE